MPALALPLTVDVDFTMSETSGIAEAHTVLELPQEYGYSWFTFEQYKEMMSEVMDNREVMKIWNVNMERFILHRLQKQAGGRIISAGHKPEFCYFQLPQRDPN